MQWREQLTRRFPALARLSDSCFVVGGAVRDLLLGREPKDADLACTDPLAAAQSVRDRVIRLGDDEQLTAYRVIDGPYEYDFAEIVGRSLDVDLARRDFTMNAMAVDLSRDVLLDPHGGQRDIAARVVRMVRASNFDDDPLRVLKGVRMAIAYDFAIEGETLEAIRSRASRILDVAGERVVAELAVILGSGKLRRAIALLRETGLDAPLGLRSSQELFADDVSLAGAYALLIGEPRAFAERWRWSAELLRDVLTLQRLVQACDRIALYDAGAPLAAQLPAVLRALGRSAELDVPDFTTRALLSGGEIAELAKIEPGQALGRIKRMLLEAQLRGEVTTRDEAIAFVRGAATSST